MNKKKETQCTHIWVNPMVKSSGYTQSLKLSKWVDRQLDNMQVGYMKENNIGIGMQVGR